MPGLDPGIHGEARPRRLESFRAIALLWIAGSSPAMTAFYLCEKGDFDVA
jgi:hypothetical protein